MTIRTILLKPIAFLAGKHASHEVRKFLAAHRHTRMTQDRLLAELLSRHAQTDFGREHGFDKIRNYEELKSAVPIGSFETFRPYVQRVLQGQTTALLPPGEKPLMFSLTSGTTGQPKYIPVTQRFADGMQRGFNVFGLMTLRDHPKAWLRSILQISSPMRESDSPTGLPCGAISGLMAATQKRIVRRMYVVPQGVSAIKDAPSRYYTILRYGVGQDVSLITTANPSSTIKLIENGQLHAERLIRDVADGTFNPPSPVPAELGLDAGFRPDPALARRLEEGVRRDGKLLPRHFWNVELLLNWTGGTLELYLRRLRELFDNAPVRDIGLLASEGRFSLPMADNTTAGVAEITGNFLEFIPAAQRGQANPPTLRADELEIGQEYVLVFSNWTGLWRYNLDDCVRVVDKFGDSPVFEFLNRGTSTVSITGEKVTEHQVVEAMRTAAAAVDVDVERFRLEAHFADTPYYLLQLDNGGTAHAQPLAAGLDEALSELNMEYHSKRTSGRLGPIQVQVLPDGVMEQAEQENIRARRGRPEQYKHQYLRTDVVDDDRCK